MISLPQLAKTAIKHYLDKNDRLELPSDAPLQLKGKSLGCFVSIHLPNGGLRGCIGTIEPTKANLGQEIIDNAIAAATADPRFPPLQSAELESLEISVDVLTEPEKISDSDQLDPRRYGLIVQAKDGRRGLLLPDLEGVESIQQQIDIAARKAKINPDQDEYQLYRFLVKRHK